MTALRVAVVTGAGSGIGRELALACGREGMAVAIADIEPVALHATETLLRTMGVPCLAMPVDVSRSSEVETFARTCWDAWGQVDWLFNNAGVAVLGPAWDATDDDWDWVFGVNVRGVANGVRSFVPRIRQSGRPAHIVNTASAAGLAAPPGSAVYCASKHAVVAFSECLAQDLEQAGAPIGVSVLCPSLVQTGIGQSQRNRPADLSQTVAPAASYDERVRLGMAASAVSAADVAAFTLQGIRSGLFYLVTHAQTGSSVERKMNRILTDFRAGPAGATSAAL
jgi:NAD(P)-dependent dehydrogenase (short-subunit alcohol dehydrogenase family)